MEYIVFLRCFFYYYGAQNTFHFSIFFVIACQSTLSTLLLHLKSFSQRRLLDAEKMCVTEDVCLQEWLSQTATKGVRDRWLLMELVQLTINIENVKEKYQIKIDIFFLFYCLIHATIKAITTNSKEKREWHLTLLELQYSNKTSKLQYFKRKSRQPKLDFLRVLAPGPIRFWKGLWFRKTEVTGEQPKVQSENQPQA